MVLRIFYWIKVRFFLFAMRNTQEQLEARKRLQLRVFTGLKITFAQKYKAIKNSDRPRLTIPLWYKYNKQLEKFFLPSPPFYFLRAPEVLRTMFVTAGGKLQQEETAFLESRFKKGELRRLLEEDLVGGPILLDSKYLTSHNSIHHLYHLARFLNATDCNLRKTNVVVEWGGGYGSMAKIFARLRGKPTTYILVDTAMFCCIQWLYLASILGEKTVRLIQSPQEKIEKGKINILPVGYVQKYKIQADLFISTWALSESSKFSQDLVIKRKWFGAKNILLAYQEPSGSIPYADRINSYAALRGAKIGQIEFLPGNFYAFL